MNDLDLPDIPNVPDKEIILQLVIENRKRHILQTNLNKHNFQLRTSVLYENYMKMSAKNKKKLVSAFLDNVKNIFLLVQLVSGLQVKLTLYRNVQVNDFILDKDLLDHNRMISVSNYKKSLEDNVEWFRSLDEHDQIFVLGNMFRLSSGSILRRITLIIFTKIQFEFDIHRTHFVTEVMYLGINKDKNSQQNIVDIESPAVRKQRDRWKQLMSDYRNEVIYKCIANTMKVDMNAIAPSAAPSIGKFLDEKVDILQVLPVWIVKQIFSYFDQETLIIASNINIYWKYIVDDIVEEQKAREALDKSLAKRKEEVDPVKLKAAMDKMATLKRRKKKLNFAMEKGTLAKKILPSINDECYDICMSPNIVTNILNQRTLDLRAISSNLDRCIRFTRDKKGVLYKYCPWPKYDEKQIVPSYEVDTISSIKFVMSTADITSW